MHDLIRDIALCIGGAWLLGVGAQWLRQPVILAYLAAGFILGPSALGWIHEQESITTIAGLGLIFLLFMIGLEIDLKKILSAGSSILVTAGIQIGATVSLGVLIFLGLGFSLGTSGNWDALYLPLAAAFSSTVIIVKILYDKREIDTLAGRITLGVMVIQDLVTILFLAIQPNLDSLRVSILFGSLLRVVALVGAALLISRYVLPPLFHRIARLPELVLVGAIAWCFFVGELASRLELSREMGALVAGVALSTFPYALDVTSRVTSLRDFFVTLFFVGLGMKIQRPDLAVIGWALVLSIFTLGTRFVTVFIPLQRLKQGLRGSLLPAINLCQISEFSLVLMELGASERFQHVSPLARDATSLAFVLLAAVSTFAMTRSDRLTRSMIPWVKRLGFRDLDHRGKPSSTGKQSDSQTSETNEVTLGKNRGGRILLLGFYRTASSLLEEIRLAAPDLLDQVKVVDFNPDVHAELRRRGIAVVYGDITQRDTLIQAGVGGAQILVCTIPDSLLKGTDNLRLIRTLRELNPSAKILTTVERLHDAAHLMQAGANYVCAGRLLEGSDLLEALRAADEGLLEQKRHRFIEQLTKRREVVE
jgi:Kef-type K+ transport system membrane component KefB